MKAHTETTSGNRNVNTIDHETSRDMTRKVKLSPLNKNPNLVLQSAALQLLLKLKCI